MDTRISGGKGAGDNALCVFPALFPARTARTTMVNAENIARPMLGEVRGFEKEGGEKEKERNQY